jgi:hypothetical protein
VQLISSRGICVQAPAAHARYLRFRHARVLPILFRCAIFANGALFHLRRGCGFRSAPPDPSVAAADAAVDGMLALGVGTSGVGAADTAEASCITLVWISSSNPASPRPPLPPRTAVRAGGNFTAAAAEAMIAAAVATAAPGDVVPSFTEELLPAQGVVGQACGGVDGHGRENFVAESEPLSLLRRESRGPLEAAGFSAPPSRVAETGTVRDDCRGMEDRHSGTCKPEDGEAHPRGNAKNARVLSGGSFSLGDGQRHEWLPETAPPLRDGRWDDVARSEDPWEEATASAAQPSAEALPRRTSTAAWPRSSLDGNGLTAESLDARMRGALVDNFCRY